MGRKKTAIQQADDASGLPVTLQNVADGVEDELLVIDTDYRVGFVNSAVLSRFRKEAESLIGGLCYKVLHERDKPCGAPLWDCLLREVLQSGRASTAIHHVRAFGGADTYLKITAYPLHDSYGNIKAVLEVRRDVTAERQLETQILRRHHQLSALSHISSAVSGLRDLDAVLRIALDNVLELINGAVGGILLLDKDASTLRYRVQHGLSARFAEEMRLSLGEGISGRVAQTGESILLEDIFKDPRVAHSELVSAEGIKGFVSIPLKVKDRVVGVMNVASHVAGHFGADDVSLLNSIGDYLGTAIEQAKLYERLTRAGERYRALLQHALTAQEQERKRIAQELHDETSQSLTSLSLSLKAIIGMAEMRGIGDAEFMQRLQTTHSYAVHASNEIVKIMKELRPTLLDELGLPAAIHRYAKNTIQSQGINLTTEFAGADQRLPSEVEVTLFRVAQGLLGNVLEHSGAKNVSINLECNASECVLRIDDDGKGFNVSKLTKVEPSGRGAGLFTMRERIRLLGGTSSIVSKPGKGTKVMAKVPLVRNVEEEDEEDKGINS